MPYKTQTPEQLEAQRASRRKHYARNREQYYARNAEKKRALSDELRARKSKPCMDCGGIFHFSAMDFDHRPGETKHCNPAQLVQRGSWRLLEEELSKCDLVCANCHRVRTYLRMQADKSDVPDS